ncbi:MAG: NAD(P)H-dependent oxidoreductase [Actinobacteria bacterium]|nr:NAD(P)H-dependent oxidoreductase [Actinomycetota bacterium]
MTQPFHALGVSGSLRADSSNTGLVRMAARLAPAGLTVELVDWIDQLPYYNADLEADLPEVVRRWRDDVMRADAIVMGLPEYNWGPSAVLKNAIDWATRPYGGQALRGKVIALVTSAGKSGGSHVQDSLGPILGMLGNTIVTEPPVQIVMGPTRISADGQTDEEEIIELVSAKMAAVFRTLQERSAG